MATWDPANYLQFADQRSRPFVDLLSMVGAAEPTVVVDLGCGPGQLTASLAERWPGATIVGIDSSPEMVASAAQHATDRITFDVADLGRWTPDRPVDVIVSNATLQWVPGHRLLLSRFVDWLRPGGWLALQVPGNYEEPSHQLLRSLASSPEYADATADIPVQESFAPAIYLGDLDATGCRVEAWETTYLHVLRGPDPVFRWISGTGARPYLQALTGSRRHEFEEAYKEMLREAYPERNGATVLPFRRIFVVAHKAAGEAEP